ncbi:MAG: DnaD domain protein [Bacilli bacterium]|nr:DnaD domain protein [Bacilli bacterium]
MSNLESIQSEDSYIVNLMSILGGADRTSLVMLYQPLCGYEAVSLYLNLWAQAEHYKKNSAFKFDFLTKMMNCELEDIEVYKNKLEGIGLLKTYLNEELRVYKYELYAPLTPKDFFTHELLGTLYKQIMPKRSYEKIKSSFEVETSDYDNYTDITHKFNDVYNIDFNDVSSLQEVIRGGANLANKSSSEIESNFSLSLFLVALNEKKIKKSLITTSFVELLKSMASLYKLDESELCEILSTSIEGVGNKAVINFDTFRSKCYSYKKIPTMDTKETKRYTDKRIGMAKKVELLKGVEPFEYLKIRQNNEDPSFQNIKLLEDLSIVSKLSNEVINVLIDYVLIKQSGRLPYNYVMKIASSLSNAGIRTAEEAMSYFSNITNRASNSNNSSNVSQSVTVSQPISVAPVVKQAEPINTTVLQESTIDEAMELELLKAARRKRKNSNGNKED